MREREEALTRLQQLQREVQASEATSAASPHLHAVRKVSELRTMPPGVLKAVEWQLRRDLYEVERAMRQQQEGAGGGLLWGGLGNNGSASPPSNGGRLFDFGGGFGGDQQWSLGNNAQQFGSIVQQ